MLGETLAKLTFEPAFSVPSALAGMPLKPHTAMIKCIELQLL